MIPVLQIAGLTLQTMGLVGLLAGWLGIILTAREANRRGIKGETVWDAGFYALIAGLIGARLWYVAAHWSAYQADLRQVVALNLGTMAYGPGVIIGASAALAYLQRRAVLLSRLADALAPGLLLGLAVFRLGDHLTGRVLGTPTNVPWAVELWGMRRHPVALYEAGAMLLILALIWRLRRVRADDGFLFLLALFLGSAARLFLEAFRADSPQLAGGLRAIQVVALAIMLGTLTALYHQHFAAVPSQPDQVEGQGV